ncbi:MAG: hypothetical protein AB1640_11465 [bacterium]
MTRRLADRLLAFRHSLGTAALVAAAGAFFAAAIPGAILGYRGYRFAWTDPRFCFSCHMHDYAVVAWKKSAHGDVTTCHDCHHMALFHYTYIGARTFINPPKFPEELETPPSIPNNLCMQCHVRGTVRRDNWTLPFQFDRLKKIPTIDSTAGHRWHMGAATDKPTPEVLKDESAKGTAAGGFRPRGAVNCWHCHGSRYNRAHSYRATDTNCRSCHAESHLSEQLRFAGTDCLTCHINAFVLDYRNPASRALQPEEVQERKGLDDLLEELKQKYPIEEMVAE